MKKNVSLASEIITDQRKKIEEQIKFYEELKQALLADADKVEAKANGLREYLNRLE